MNNKTLVSSLYEGTFSVGRDEEFERITKSDPPNKGALKLSINPFLIQKENHNILFDAGIGDLFGEDSSIDTMHNNLAEHSLNEYDITDIFISHLHFDHMGGLANRKHGFWELTFPDASIWVSKDGWKRLQETIDEHNEDEIEFFHFVDNKADLNFLAEEDNPIPHVRVERIGGHTKFHQVLFYENGDDRYLMAGDVIGTRGAINRTYKAKYDEEPEKSLKKREELQKLAFEQKYTIMAYHETVSPLFKLVSHDQKKGYSIENISG
ncbi:MBL fold metallo-hydrolase [Rhodohalobacter sp. 614A]|uniref:MBL fold metallo-hydrolase n=1 Tax=Rhodohalobacter sp. 614A TaxID=2908649 RepID=UPI001F3497D5|nr:MBL fold metallo-hydrolase [Rhodohalobacter sp. 614A]